MKTHKEAELGWSCVRLSNNSFDAFTHRWLSVVVKNWARIQNCRKKNFKGSQNSRKAIKIFNYAAQTAAVIIVISLSKSQPALSILECLFITPSECRSAWASFDIFIYAFRVVSSRRITPPAIGWNHLFKQHISRKFVVLTFSTFLFVPAQRMCRLIATTLYRIRGINKNAFNPHTSIVLWLPIGLLPSPKRFTLKCL